MLNKNNFEIEISVVSPLHNESLNLKEHFKSIEKSLSEFGRSFEIIFINDGSTDSSEKEIFELYNENSNVTAINLYKKNGKAAALETGFEYAKGKYIVIIDSDLQYDPSDIPSMILELENGFDVISGKRISREDNKSVIVTSLIFNSIIRKLSGLNFRDFFSGLKCFKKEVIDYLSLYGDLYRFAVVFAHKQNFSVKEMPVKHYRRNLGESKYSFFKRSGMAILDIMTILLTITFNENLAYYAGLAGSLLFSCGSFFIFAAFILNARIINFDSILFYLGIITIFISIQLLLLKKISFDFFYRHRKDLTKRKRNIKNIFQK
ncbi:glycosyltransferase [Candidatus Dependentiae bacterium]|nr:glycosyltransferase [Candidatus Dependentiae bacterium]